MQQKVYTIGELIKILKNYDPKFMIVYSEDIEGNAFHYLFTSPTKGWFVPSVHKFYYNKKDVGTSTEEEEMEIVFAHEVLCIN